VAVTAATQAAWSQGLEADLSSHLIAIPTDFTGTEVVLFGAVAEPGDIAVVVQGPPERAVVRRKARVAGIWMNRSSMTFDNVPSFYSVATTRAIETFADERLLEREGIGLDYLRLEPSDAGNATETEIGLFRDALIRAKQREEVYVVETGQVSFRQVLLFRTTVSFPANVPTGQYLIRVFLIREGNVVTAQTTPLFVSKIGVGSVIFSFAQNYAAAYGLAAIVVAVLAGWLASMMFRRN
jgi:uncharacterized protein (TIGR02186 family)